MERRALFPGSFDPFTLGHKVVVDQALELFDRIVIAVGVNSEKRGLMTAENRVRLIRDLYRADRSFLPGVGHTFYPARVA